MIRQPRILKVDESYTFARYAELPAERDEILADLGGTISSGHVTFPSYGGELHLEDLGDRLTDAFQFTTISSEQARREFLMAPIISFVCRHTQQKVLVNGGMKPSRKPWFPTRFHPSIYQRVLGDTALEGLSSE